MYICEINYIASFPYLNGIILSYKLIADSGFGNGKGNSFNSQNRIVPSDSALFTTRNNTKVIAQRGGLAVLPCAVKWNPTATVSSSYYY